MAVALGFAFWIAAAGPSWAGWAPTTRLTSATGVDGVSTAINARGDAAVAWVVDPASAARAGDLQVRVAYRRGWGGRFRTRTVWHRAGFKARGPSVALDPRGELTVAWIDEASTNGLLHGHKTVRAAYRTPAGHWSDVQAIGRTSPFWYAYPTVAAARSGTVLLTYNSVSKAAPGMAAVWRSPGHHFGPVHALPTGLIDPTTLFDAAGRAYVAGNANCDGSHSRGVLLRTNPSSRHFRAMRTVAPTPSSNLRLVLTGSGRGALAWRAVACSTSEDLTGPIHAARLSHAAAGKPTVLDPQNARGPILSGAPSDGADVAWNTFPTATSTAAILTSHMNVNGLWTSPAFPQADWIASTADATGNQIVMAGEIGARPTNGPIQTAPITTSRAAAGATDGTGLIIANGLATTTWRP